MIHDCLVEHFEQEAAYWWFVNKRAAVKRLLDRHCPTRGRLLEIGCGGGLFGAMLQENGWRVTCADRNPLAACYAIGHGVRRAAAFDAGRGWPFAPDSFDAFLMLDVLEHIERDEAALREAHRVLRPGGIGIVLVPAYPFLFSAWDTYVGHYRRYSRRALAATAGSAGLELVHGTYWNAITLPAALVLRLKDRFLGVRLERGEFPRVPRAVNTLLKAYGAVEAAWLAHGTLPAGLSYTAVLRKPAP